MKRSTIIYLVIFLVLGITAVALLSKNRNSTLPEDLQDFAVDDTAAISRIELTDKNQNHVTLVRQGKGNWMVDDKYKAQRSQVEILLETIKLVQVKNPVPLAARDNVIKSMAAEATKIQIYKGSDLAKTYYVGGTTPDELGTMMLLEGAREPYVTYIPGFEGYLTTRYITKEQDWRSTEIYHLNPADIQQVDVKYPAMPQSSFTLLVQGDQYKLQQGGGAQAQAKLSDLDAKRYLAGFRGINYESFPQLSPQQRDSIAASTPFAVVQVKSSSDKPPVLRLYLKRADEAENVDENDKISHNKFYGLIGDGSKEVVLVQNLVAGKLLPSYSELAGNGSK